MTTRVGKHTETTLKARHQEALDIFKAWQNRHNTTGGTEAKAAELQMNEAWDWVEQTAKDLALYRDVTRQKTKEHGRNAPNTTNHLHTHRSH